MQYLVNVVSALQCGVGGFSLLLFPPYYISSPFMYPCTTSKQRVLQVCRDGNSVQWPHKLTQIFVTASSLTQLQLLIYHSPAK